MLASSTATMTLDAPDCKALSATRTTIGLPAISASGLFGRRVEAKRAGITAINDVDVAVIEF